MKWAVPFLTLLMLQPCAAQKAEERNAHEAIIRFLQGVKTSSTPEGKQILADAQWINGRADRGTDFYAHSEFTEAKSTLIGLFDADIPAIRSFHEVFDMKLTTKDGVGRNTKYMVIAFKEAASGKWKILSALQDIDDMTLDMDRQADYYKDHLDDTSTTSERENYTTYGLWLLRSGHIIDARDALKKARTAEATSALDDAVKEGPDRIRDLQIDALLDVIARIAPNLH